MVEHLPDLLISNVEMPRPNSNLLIYEGDYILRSNLREYKINGSINFKWFPTIGAKFEGKSNIDLNEIISISDNKTCDVGINGSTIGKAHITEISSAFADDETKIQGFLFNQVVLGDKTIPVERVRFSIPNLREFFGATVKWVTEERIQTLNNRISFENDDHLILIDKCPDFKDRIEVLKNNGGYSLGYFGEVSFKNRSISHEDALKLLNCFSTFLTFVNGRHTSALFIQGIVENEIIWQDFSNFHVEIFKEVESWPEHFSVNGLNRIWRNFYTIWKDVDDKIFLKTLIHWYTEANSLSGSCEGSMIMAQTALELLYNWWIVENKKMITGKNSESISASNKIRLLLSQLKIPHSVPMGFNHLEKYIKKSNIEDAPEAIVQIRNSIVHSQEDKRKKLSEIDEQTKYEALQLFLWYIELSLLRILDFDGKYYNRCSNSKSVIGSEEYVPWINQGISLD